MSFGLKAKCTFINNSSSHLRNRHLLVVRHVRDDLGRSLGCLRRHRDLHDLGDLVAARRAHHHLGKLDSYCGLQRSHSSDQQLE